MGKERRARLEMVEIGRRLWLRGFAAANDGNLSLRLGMDTYLITPAGMSKGFLAPGALLVIDGQGLVRRGRGRPSSEMHVHLAVYRVRPDAGAVLHAHPPAATAFAVAGEALTRPVLPEVIMTLGEIPLAGYAKPGTPVLGEIVAAAAASHDAILMANHGAVTIGSNLREACDKMERLEHFAAVTLGARQLGGERELPAESVRELTAGAEC